MEWYYRETGCRDGMLGFVIGLETELLNRRDLSDRPPIGDQSASRCSPEI